MRANETTLTAVRELVADILGAETDEVEAESLFFDDLGGESIDFLDLTFRLEKHFNIRLHFRALERELSVDETGRLTADSIQLLQARLPTLDTTPLEAERKPLRSVLSVQVIADAVQRELDASSTGSGAA